MPEASGTATLAKFFGRLPGQSLSDFKNEVSKLSEADRIELVEGAKHELASAA